MKKPLVTTENYLIDALSQKSASCPINAPPPPISNVKLLLSINHQKLNKCWVSIRSFTVLLKSYFLLLNCLVFTCETKGEFDITSKTSQDLIPGTLFNCSLATYSISSVVSFLQPGNTHLCLHFVPQDQSFLHTLQSACLQIIDTITSILKQP